MSNIQEKVCCFELSSVASLDKSHQVKHRTNEQREAQMKTLNVNQHIMQYKHVICCHNLPLPLQNYVQCKPPFTSFTSTRVMIFVTTFYSVKKWL